MMAHADLALVIGDDPPSGRLLVDALDAAGFVSAVVPSLNDALAWLARRAPAVIVLACGASSPDALDALHALKAEPRAAAVPIVAIVPPGDDDQVARALDAGASDVVRAPLRESEIIARIRGQLRVRGYIDALARRERDANVVLELTQALSSTLDFRDILFTVVRRIAEFASVERCSLVLARDQSAVGYVVAASDDKELRDLPLDLGKYPEIREVMQTGETLIIDDPSTHPLFDVIRTELPQNAFRWLALIPVLYEGKPMGVLILRSLHPVTLVDHEISLARTVVNATAIALRNARILQSLRDQTQQINFARFEAERRLKALQRYADFFDSTPDGIVVIDTDAQILFSNPRAQAITGRSEEELSGCALTALVDPKDRARVDEICDGFTRGAFPHMIDITIRRPSARSSERRTLNVSFSAVLREESGATLVSFRDVTDDRATAAELTKTKEFLERVIDSSADAIVSADMRGTIRLFNRAAERIYGYATGDVVGRMSVRDLYPDGVAREVMSLIRSADHGGPGRLHGHRTWALAKDRAQIPVLLSAALILEDGSPVGSVGILTDLRDRLRMEARLTEAQEELRARETQALIAELAGAAAHELNQPLTSVLGYAELIRRRVDDPTSVESAANILISEAERMADIVRKIGRITRYETKSYVGSSKIVDLDRSSAEDLSTRATVR